MAGLIRQEFQSSYQWKNLAHVSQISSGNGPPSSLIQIFLSDRSEVQTFCAFNDLTVLTGLAELMERPQEC
jgi:hypothetical protein